MVLYEIQGGGVFVEYDYWSRSTLRLGPTCMSSTPTAPRSRRRIRRCVRDPGEIATRRTRQPAIFRRHADEEVIMPSELRSAHGGSISVSADEH